MYRSLEKDGVVDSEGLKAHHFTEHGYKSGSSLFAPFGSRNQLSERTGHKYFY